MEEKNDLIKVGKYDLRYNELLSIDIEELDIFRSKGLPAHMVKRKHYNCLKYIDYLPEIIENPDYIGINPNENDKSIEFIKKYSKNVLVGVKKDEVIGLGQFGQRDSFGRRDGVFLQIIFSGTDVVFFGAEYDRDITPYLSEVVPQHQGGITQQ